MKNKKWLLALVLTLVMAILAACGGDDSGDDSSDKDDSASSDKAQVLVFGRGGDSVSLDGAAVTDGESIKVTQNIYETLLNFNEKDTTVEASLAKEWEVTPDGLTYTFKLQEGVKFHDGTDFNADAVKANFERWSKGAKDEFYYYNSMFRAEDKDLITSIETPDANTVVITLARPQAPFLKNIAMAVFGIASPAAFDTLGENPVGTGPFKFQEWKRNDSITLVKNEE
jgi:peptide/nickel transport system substrate-binding protein